ncbi:hypothetical protein PSCICO_12820 [Pseudomonas cichorii]|uniref:N-acetyltransferase n=1 Tax=Pseudomonas cichorii TaxID=36746 RepID=UPI0019100FCB|nr:N-acetyltransferase [Pseudomonas cichorii]GFM85883.1 hypothetical protein PSCICO_12820 [Pseudomonas cichorii]
MVTMADPLQALISFQQDVRRRLPVVPTERYRGTYVIRDELNEKVRYTYLKIEHGRVKAIAMFVTVGLVEGIPCFQMGYAVPVTYRNRGWATQIIKEGIDELQRGFSAHGHGDFYVEAVVGMDNIASQHVAQKVLGQSSPITDGPSGQSALAYMKRIAC